MCFNIVKCKKGGGGNYVENKLASLEAMQVQNAADPPSDPFNSIGCRTISVAKNKLI